MPGAVPRFVHGYRHQGGDQRLAHASFAADHANDVFYTAQLMGRKQHAFGSLREGQFSPQELQSWVQFSMETHFSFS